MATNQYIIRAYDSGHLRYVTDGTLFARRSSLLATHQSVYPDLIYNITTVAAKGIARSGLRFDISVIPNDYKITNMIFYIQHDSGAGASNTPDNAGVCRCNLNVPDGDNLATNNDSIKSNYREIFDNYAPDHSNYIGALNLFSDDWYRVSIPASFKRSLSILSTEYDLGLFFLDDSQGNPLLPDTPAAHIFLQGNINDANPDNHTAIADLPYLDITTVSRSDVQNIPVGSSPLAIDNNLLLLNNTSISSYANTNIECNIGGMPLKAAYHNSGYYALQVIVKDGVSLSSEENIFMGYPLKTYTDGNQRYFGTTIYQNGIYDHTTVMNGFPFGVDSDGTLMCIVRDDLGKVDEEAEFIWGSSKVTASRIGDDWYWTIVDQS